METNFIFDSTQRLFWLYLASSALIAAIYTAVVARRNGWSLKFILSETKNHLTHPSTILDLKYFFAISFIKLLLIAPLLLSAKEVALFIFELLFPYMGPPPEISYASVSVLYAAVLFVISDFSRYWVHRLMHENKFLWHFHKVHHSAEIMNPLTFYRVHPVENFLFGLRYSLVAGVVTGVFLAIFGPKLNMWSILGGNAFVFIFSLLGTHLRHSHLYLSYPKWIEHFFVSPAMHQVHHYSKYALKNYGSYIALWDWMFDSFIASKDAVRQKRFGFPFQKTHYNYSVVSMLLTPFAEAFDIEKNHAKSISKKI